MRDIDQEIKRLTRTVEELEVRGSRTRARRDPGSPSYLGKVYDGGALPTTPGKCVLTNPVRVRGAEAAGPGTVEVNTDRKVPVFIIGPAVPRVGQIIRARLVRSGRWVAHCYPPCTGSVCFFAETCADGIRTIALAGVAITITGPGGTFSGTTDSFGSLCFSDIPDGTYTATAATMAGYTGGGAIQVEVGCNEQSGAGWFFTPNSPVGKICIYVYGCGSAYSGPYTCPNSLYAICAPVTATVTLSYNGTVIGTQVASGGVPVCFSPLPAIGSGYTYTAEACNYVTVTGAISIGACEDSGAIAVLQPAPGFMCSCPGPGNAPTPANPTMTDVNGPHALVNNEGTWTLCYVAPTSNAAVCGSGGLQAGPGGVVVCYAIGCIDDGSGGIIFHVVVTWWAQVCQPGGPGTPCVVYLFGDDCSLCSEFPAFPVICPDQTYACGMLLGRADVYVAPGDISWCPFDFSFEIPTSVKMSAPACPGLFVEVSCPVGGMATLSQ